MDDYDPSDELNKLPLEWPMPKGKRMTTEVHRALNTAASAEQLVAAFMMSDENNASKILKKIRPDLTAEIVLDAIKTEDDREDKKLAKIVESARSTDCERVGTEHLLMGMLRCREGLDLFAELNLDCRQIRQETWDLITKRRWELEQEQELNAKNK